MPTSVATFSKLLFLAILVTSCPAQSRDFSAHEGCSIDPSVWRQVQTPPQRETLLDLPDKASKTPVRKYFTTADDLLREVWFEASNGDLQICLYDVRKSCRYGGTLRTVIFTKVESSWEAGLTALHTLCSD